MEVAGSTYYHARVLHHHPWRAADYTVYKSSKLITTTAAVFPYRRHAAQPASVFWGCDEMNPQQQKQQHTVSRISYLAQQQQQAVEVATNGSCANGDTNT